MRRGYSLTSKETAAVSVAVGFGVAAVAGLGIGAALGAGVYSLHSASNNRRDKKEPLSQRHIKKDAEGRLEGWTQLLKIAQQGGVSPDARAEMWPFLLGVYSPNSTATERATELTKLHRLYTRLVLVCEELDKEIEEYKNARKEAEQLNNTGGKSSKQHKHGGKKGGKKGKAHKRSNSTADTHQTLNNKSSSSAAKEQPQPMPGNLAAFSEAHRIIVMDALRTDLSSLPDITSSSSSSFLSKNRTGSFSGDNSATGGASTTNQEHQPTVTVLPVASSEGLPELMLVEPLPIEPLSPSAMVAAGRLPVWRSELAMSTIDCASHVTLENRETMMRLVNVLSAYSVHDPETGYCQGMSDLAAVFVQLFDDDALAFACFERFMRQARRNFKHDQSGITHQLSQVGRILADTDPALYAKLKELHADDCTFAYRMVIVMLRRELPLHQAATLWEVQWALEAGALAEKESNMGASISRKDSPLSSSQNSAHLSFSNNNRSTSPPLEGTNMTGNTTTAESSEAAAGLAATVASMDLAAKEALSTHDSPPRDNNGNGRRASGGGLGGSNSPSSSNSTKDKDQQREPPPDFLLQFIAAAVRAQRSKVLTECFDTDDVLRLFNSIKIDFWTALAQARKQYKAYAQGLAVLQRL